MQVSALCSVTASCLLMACIRLSSCIPCPKAERDDMKLPVQARLLHQWELRGCMGDGAADQEAGGVSLQGSGCDVR